MTTAINPFAAPPPAPPFGAPPPPAAAAPPAPPAAAAAAAAPPPAGAPANPFAAAPIPPTHAPAAPPAAPPAPPAAPPAPPQAAPAAPAPAAAMPAAPPAPAHAGHAPAAAPSALLGLPGGARSGMPGGAPAGAGARPGTVGRLFLTPQKRPVGRMCIRPKRYQEATGKMQHSRIICEVYDRTELEKAKQGPNSGSMQGAEIELTLWSNDSGAVIKLFRDFGFTDDDFITTPDGQIEVPVAELMRRKPVVLADLTTTEKNGRVYSNCKILERVQESST